jgi:hypothetical protein
MRITATIHLDRVERVDGKRADVTHKIATREEQTPLSALRAAHSHIEQRWESIAPLVEGGETLRVEIRRTRAA